MPRVKVARKSTAIDMTAMCDVAFLLLTFFILSAKPKVQDPVKVDEPSSTANIAIPENDFSTITVGQGKAFFNVQGADVRIETLKLMGTKYGIVFTPQEQEAFAGVESFGMPIQALKPFLAASSDQRSAYQQPGVPVDTTNNNQLYDWVRSARQATIYAHHTELSIAIKADGEEEYPTVGKIISSLQKQQQNKFKLITRLKTAPK